MIEKEKNILPDDFSLIPQDKPSKGRARRTKELEIDELSSCDEFNDSEDDFVDKYYA